MHAPLASPRDDAPLLPAPRSPLRMALARVTRSPGSVAGAAVLVIVVLLSLLAPLLAPYDPIAISPADYLQPPSPAHLFGTDSFGRDLFSRVLYGGRATLSVALAAVVLAGVAGTVLGLIAGYFGRWTDSIIMRFVDMLLAFPGLLLALGVVALLGPGLLNVVVAVGVSGIPGYARLVRASVLAAREEAYVEAAKAMGGSPSRVLFRHILPNVLGPVIVLSTLDVGWAILTAASLSFLGLGAQPPAPEWGAILNDGRGLLREAPWHTTFPGLTILATVLSINLLGDGLRDALDPRMYR